MHRNKMDSIFILLIQFLICFKACTAISCFECSSVNDNYCPETMTTDDEDIIPYSMCSDKLHGAKYCVKTTGVTGGCFGELHCFVCDSTSSAGDGSASCSDPNFFQHQMTSCRNVFDAHYCIKTEGIYGGSLGTKRFCSAYDMGNYCDYTRRPGDQLEYRSCVYTCTGNGCNHSSQILSPSVPVFFGLSVLTLVISLR